MIQTWDAVIIWGFTIDEFLPECAVRRWSCLEVGGGHWERDPEGYILSLALPFSLPFLAARGDQLSSAMTFCLTTSASEPDDMD